MTCTGVSNGLEEVAIVDDIGGGMFAFRKGVNLVEAANYTRRQKKDGDEAQCN